MAVVWVALFGTEAVSRYTWQMWHVRAKVQRQVRTVNVPVERANVLVDLAGR